MIIGFIKRLFAPAAEDVAAARLYSGLVDRARDPYFYISGGVSDSVDGRFDMILLHMALVTQRLEALGEGGIRLSRRLQERMVDDLDRSLREMGVGDMSVGKKMKDMASAWLGRRQAYAGAAGNFEALKRALTQNVYRKEGEHKEAAALARYVERVAAGLAEMNAQVLLVGDLPWHEVVAPAEGMAGDGSKGQNNGS